ncbi:MAG: hypothetical protein WBG32_08855 [Nodosilinea sp.]
MAQGVIVLLAANEPWGKAVQMYLERHSDTTLLYRWEVAIAIL